MNWLALIAAFAVSLLTGAFLARLLERSRPDWPPRRRLWTAASALPIFIGVATMCGILVVVATGPGTGENMQDLAVAATATVGVIFAIIALAGGFVGASLGSTRVQR